MRVTRFDNQKNLTELVEQLFKVGKTPGTKAAALNALAEANPTLDLRAGRLGERLDAGTLLVVPEVEGATHTRRSRELGDETANAMLARAKSLVAETEGSLQQSSRRSVDQLVARIEALESQELRAAGEADPDLAERLAFLGEQAKRSLEQLDERRSREQVALQAAGETAAALITLLRTGG